MRVQGIAVVVLTGFVAGCGMVAPASADENRGTMEQQMACTPDVWRLCSEHIPDRDSIVACLRQNTSQLSGACRAVFQPAGTAVSGQPGVQRQIAQPRPAPQHAYPTHPRAYDVDDDD